MSFEIKRFLLTYHAFFFCLKKKSLNHWRFIGIRMDLMDDNIRFRSMRTNVKRILSLSDSFRGTRPFSGWLTKRIEERALRFVSSSFHLRYPRSSVRPLTTSASLQKRKIAVNARRGKGVNPAHGSLDFCPASYRSVPSIPVERESLTPIEAFLLRCSARSYVW